MSDLKLGMYRHFKEGKLYRAIGIAKCSETLTESVVYQSVNTNELWHRPLSMWSEIVTYPDGTEGPRFKYVEDELREGLNRAVNELGGAISEEDLEKVQEAWSRWLV